MKHHDDIRFDGKSGKPRSQPGAVRKDVAQSSLGDQDVELGCDRRFWRSMGEEIFRAHVDFDVPSQVIDAPGLRKLLGIYPALEAFEGEGILGNPEVLFEEDRVSSGHNE